MRPCSSGLCDRGNSPRRSDKSNWKESLDHRIIQYLLIIADTWKPKNKPQQGIEGQQNYQDATSPVLWHLVSSSRKPFQEFSNDTASAATQLLLQDLAWLFQSSSTDSPLQSENSCCFMVLFFYLRKPLWQGFLWLGNFGTNFSPVHPHLFTRGMRLDNSRYDSGSTHLRQGTETTPLHQIVKMM